MYAMYYNLESRVGLDTMLHVLQGILLFA